MKLLFVSARSATVLLDESGDYSLPVPVSFRIELMSDVLFIWIHLFLNHVVVYVVWLFFLYICYHIS